MVDGHWTASKGKLLKPNLGPGAFDEITIRKITMFSQHKISLSSCLFATTMTFDGLNITDWWFGTWLLFFHMLGIIIPTDFHIFQRGWNHQPDIMGTLGTLGRRGWRKSSWLSWIPQGRSRKRSWTRTCFGKCFPWNVYIYNIIYIYMYI